MKIRDLINIVTENAAPADQLNEFFKNPFAKSQAELYPENEFARHGDGKTADERGILNGGELKTRKSIEQHPRYKELCNLCDKIDDVLERGLYPMHETNAAMEVAEEIGRDTGFSAFSVKRYCGWHQRFARGE